MIGHYSIGALRPINGPEIRAHTNDIISKSFYPDYRLKSDIFWRFVEDANSAAFKKNGKSVSLAKRHKIPSESGTPQAHRRLHLRQVGEPRADSGYFRRASEAEMRRGPGLWAGILCQYPTVFRHSTAPEIHS